MLLHGSFYLQRGNKCATEKDIQIKLLILRLPM
nr:MAG TPA: hypothetical protein [Caudoviricetes sp.]